MKIESIEIWNFKQFEHLKVEFKHQTLGEISDRFLVLGDNGTGKTSLLQAIALPLLIATGEIRNPYEFSWFGFDAKRYSKWGTAVIELVIQFDQEELENTLTVFEAKYQRNDPYYIEPTKCKQVKVRYEHGRFRYDNPEQSHLELTSLEEDVPVNIHQFRGRYYAKNLPQNWDYMPYLPGVFYFDQFRNVRSAKASTEDRRNVSSFDELREYLYGWDRFRREKPTSKRSYLTPLESHFKRVFPSRSYYGVEPMIEENPTEADYYILFNDGRRTYDIAEMSSGEQSVFPILYEIVRLHIGHSVVLIDEVDLNLHPPAAQELVSQLYDIGPTCQFILTTHSEAITSIISPSETYRLPGGSVI